MFHCCPISSFSSFSCGTVLTKGLISQESKIAAVSGLELPHTWIAAPPRAAAEHVLISGVLEGDDCGHRALAGAGCVGNTL